MSAKSEAAERLRAARAAARERVKSMREAVQVARGARKAALAEVRAQCRQLARTRRARLKSIAQRHKDAQRAELQALKRDERAACELSHAIAKSRTGAVAAAKLALADARKHLPARKPRPAARQVELENVDGVRRSADVRGGVLICPFCFSPMQVSSAPAGKCANPACSASVHATAQRERDRERAAEQAAKVSTLAAAGHHAMAASAARHHREQDIARLLRSLKLKSKSRYRASAAERKLHGGAIVTEYFAMPSPEPATWFDVKGFGATQAERKSYARAAAELVIVERAHGPVVAFARRIRAVWPRAEHWHGTAAWIASVRDLMGGDPAEFTRLLLQAHRDGLITLARFDLSAAADADLVRRSEVRDRTASYHLVERP